MKLINTNTGVKVETENEQQIERLLSHGFRKVSTTAKRGRKAANKENEATAAGE